MATYSVYRQQPRTKILILWDGPEVFSLAGARKILKQREKGQPTKKCFIVRDA
jgi:hypothetical protein